MSRMDPMLDVSHAFQPVKKVQKLVPCDNLWRCPIHGEFRFGFVVWGNRGPIPCGHPLTRGGLCGRTAQHIACIIELREVYERV